MMHLKIHNGEKIINIYPTKFNGGEVNLKIKPEDFINFEEFVINTKLTTSDDFFALALVVNAIRQESKLAKIVLMIGYLPYGRQDRVCNEGEALACKVYADLLNSLNFADVIVADPHSDVMPALLNSCSVLEQHDIISEQKVLSEVLKSDEVLIVSPDAGANKKTAKLCKEFGIPSFIRADKARDMQTGRITETIVYADDLTGKDMLIVDDICDGGYTFTELAKVLKAKGARTVSLYVTHGIFSKGVEELLDNGIDHIYTTDSFSELNCKFSDKRNYSITQESLFFT